MSETAQAWLLLVLPAVVVGVSLEAVRLGALLEIERDKRRGRYGA